MRVIAVVLLFVLLCAHGALGQSGGHIGLYADRPALSECGLTETLSVINSI